MPGPFAITPSTSTATLDASRQGTVTFTVKNTTKIRIRGIARFVATPPESVHWYTVAPAPAVPPPTPTPPPTPSPATGQPTPPVPNVRDFGPEETQTYTVNIAVPPSAAAGDYRFKLIVANEADPDDDFTESTEVGFSLAPTPEKPPSKFPIWIIPVILVILALIIGAIVLLTRDTTPPPPVETETPTPTITPTTAPTLTPSPTPRPPTITPFPVGNVVIADTGLSGQISSGALSAYGIRRVRGAPLSSYCSDGTVAAVRTGYGTTYLTTASAGEINRCNTVPILIEFASPVRYVRLTFWGASVEYEMRVYDADGSLITTVTQEALCCGNLHTVEYQQRAATIGRVEFGYTTAITGVTRIEFRN